MLTKSDGDMHQLECSLSHNLINNLSVIVGSCEILRERTLNGRFDSECSHRVDVIQRMALAMTKTLKEHEDEIDNPPSLRKGPNPVRGSGPFTPSKLKLP